MPRCYSCGQFVQKPHREVDGRVERAYCDLCHAERDWKLGTDRSASPSAPLRVPAPPLSLWDKVRRFFGV